MSNIPTKPSKFCSNCGQAVTQAAAGTSAAADDPTVKFCCECGRKLESDGTCGNNVCPFYEQVPQCG